MPFGIKPTDEQCKKAIEAVREIYKGLPETVCESRGICCRAGCPNMYYCEYLSMREGCIEKMTPEERLDLTIECVRRYLATQNIVTPKVCAFLTPENKCRAYEVRPFKCRTYGLIPSDLYKWIVKSVAEEAQVPKDVIPLCKQCNRVKIKPEFEAKYPGGCIPQETIKDCEINLRKIDKSLGFSSFIQDSGWGFLTFHDWHIMFELGEVWMERLTPLRQKLSSQEKEQFIASLKVALVQKEKPGQ